MRQRLLTVFGLCAALLAGTIAVPQVAEANQSPTAAYCVPPNQLQNGQQISVTPLNQNFDYNATCGGNYGDLWSDGPLYNPSFTYFSTSLNFTIPAMNWIVQGTRVYTPATPQTAPINLTTYWWLSSQTSQFTMTTTNTAPDNYSVLEYTVTTNSNGITAVTNPTLTQEVIAGSLALSALPANSCLQTGSNGVIQATGLPCGSGSGAIAAVTGAANISVNTVSGTATVSDSMAPTWTGAPTIASGSTTGTLNFGSDATASLQRTGTNAFSLISGTLPTLTASGGFIAGSSTYGPTLAAVNGGISGTTLTASGLSSGLCVQTTAGGQLTTTGGPCLTGSGVTAVNGSGNISVATVSGTATISESTAPTYSGSVTASQFNGSGAGLTPGTVSNSALATTPVTSVGVSSPLNTTGGTTPTLSIGSNPAFAGTPTSVGYQTTTGPFVAGNGTAFIPTNPDLSASRSTSTGALFLGGTASKCQEDYGVTTASTWTIGCAENVSGALTATTLAGSGLTSGDCVQVTTGGVLTTTGSACGSATSVTAVNGGGPISASTSSGTVTLGCPTCLLAGSGGTLTAGSNVSLSGGNTVNVVGSPTFTGSIGVDGNSAPTHGIEGGTGAQSFMLISGVSPTGASPFQLTSANCGGNDLVQFFNGATDEDQFGCNGTIQVGSSTYGGTAASVAGGIGVDTNAAGSTGVTGGVAGTTPFNFTDASNTTATEGFVFNTSTACKATTDTLFKEQVNGTTESYSDCSGDSYSTSVNQTNTSFTPGLCFLCIGQAGVATAGSSGIRLGNSAVASTGYTILSTMNSGSVAGVQNTVLGINNTGNRVAAIDNGGDFGASGNGQFGGSVIAGQPTAASVSSGDLAGSRSSSTGAMTLGGSSSSCQLDYGVTSVGVDTFGCSLVIGGTNAITAGSFNVTNTNMSSCYYCVGTAGNYTTGIAAYGTGVLSDYESLGTTPSTCTTGAVPGSGLSITDHAAGLIDCWDSGGSYGLIGDITVGHSVRSIREVVGGYNTATTITSSNYGDVEASRSTSTGNLNLGGTSSSCNLDFGITTTGIDTFGCATATPKLLQSASNDYAGTCTNSSSTTCTATLNAAYTSTPLCFAQDQSATNKVNVACAVSGTTITVTNAPTDFFGTCTMSSGTSCTISVPYGFFSGSVCISSQGTSNATSCNLVATTITVTAASSNSNTWGVHLIGTPSSTTHTFNYLVVGNPN